MTFPPPPPGDGERDGRPDQEGPGGEVPSTPPDRTNPYFPPAGPLPPEQPAGIGGSRGVGIAVGMLAPFVVGVLITLVSAGLMEATGDSALGAVVYLLLSAVPLVVPLVLLFVPRWRRFAAGVLLGYGILLVVAAGACVALIGSLSQLGG